MRRVDSLFICLNLELEREAPSEGELQRKAAEAVSWTPLTEAVMIG